MKSVPSLVASSTVGVAATGLVFGKPQHTSTLPRSNSNNRKANEPEMRSTPLVARTRPATSPALCTPLRDKNLNSSPASCTSPGEQLDHSTQLTSVEAVRQPDSGPSALRRRGSTPGREPGSDDRKDSVSSRGSWYRNRLWPTISTSYGSGSPRSSVGPDSPSIQFSHGSAVPIISQPFNGPTSTTPNKLVKRGYSSRDDSGEISRSGSRSRAPTLRRPATSHQRSVTLQQQFREQEPVAMSPRQVSSPEVWSGSRQPHATQSSRSYYRHFFESRVTRFTKERSVGDGISQSFLLSTKRVALPEHSEAPSLMKPDMIIDEVEMEEDMVVADLDDFQFYGTLEDTREPPLEKEPHKRPRRSMSMHLTSPTNWITRTGSLRATKRSLTSKGQQKRHASAPLTSETERPKTSTMQAEPRLLSSDHLDYSYASRQPEPKFEEFRSRNSSPALSQSHRGSSSPLPVLSRLSSFNLDLTRMALSSSSSGRHTPTSPLVVPSSHVPTVQSLKEVVSDRTTPIANQTTQIRVISLASDRASTLIGSDNEVKELLCGEDDDMDFQSETVYDSFRTQHSGSLRIRSPKLDSIFDDSPVDGNRTRTHIMDDVYSGLRFRDVSGGIMEEDETATTPIREGRSPTEEFFTTPTRKRLEADEVVRSSPPSFSLASQRFGRLSLEDDEEDEDWTKDDDSIAISNSLSPPSTYNSSRVNPAIRAALASSSGNVLPHEDRPKNVFDWSEPLAAKKPEPYGESPRPRTPHAKQITDGRNGRAVGRKALSTLHNRSQSVPVVPQVANDRDASHLNKKFGTWGLCPKGVSEDWDNDFEFDGIDLDDVEIGEAVVASVMVVPAAIQASQASVVGHVGQIREVCILVDELKRLRSLAKEKGLLYSNSASLWRQADGIIALAAPEEDENALSAAKSPASQRKQSIGEQGWDSDFETQDSPSSANNTTPHSSKLPVRFANDNFQVRRRSVFSPDDDIFGVLPSIESPSSPAQLPNSGFAEHPADVARSVMVDIHQNRVVSDPISADGTIEELPRKMPFDTTSLRDLVQRASSLARLLKEIIRKHDDFNAAYRAKDHDRRDRDSSPAFTRVFTPELQTPPKLPRSQSNNSMMNGSIDGSPTRGIGQRMHMMTVV